MCVNKVSRHKVGRNDPCPCGSGKKYKNCCYPDKTRAWKTAGSHDSPAFRVKATRKPEPITSHLDSSNGSKTWKSRPRLLSAQTIGKKVEDSDESVLKIIEPVLRGINALGLSGITKQNFVNRVRYVDHKLHAVKYHLKNYEQAEKDKIEEFSKNYKPPTGVQEIIEEPRLIYEVESLLFQVKSCLDVLSRVINSAFHIDCYRFGEDGDLVINVLQRNCPTSLSGYAKEIIKLIEEAQGAWIVELIQMRDQITHESSLEGFHCFMKDPYIGGDTANIHYPTMPNNRRALEYCQDTWKRLLSFCEDFLKLSLEAARKR